MGRQQRTSKRARHAKVEAENQGGGPRVRIAGPADPRERLRRRIAAGSACVLMSGMLAVPNAAFAAELLQVNGTDYTEPGASGAGWAWVSRDGLELDGFQGTGIYAVGDLDITLTGDSAVAAEESDHTTTAVMVEDGDLTITGPGSLTARANYDGISAEGDLTIDGARVDAAAYDYAGESSAGIAVYGGSLTVAGGAEVDAHAEFEGAVSYGIYVSGGGYYYGEGDVGVSISDSRVRATAESTPAVPLNADSAEDEARGPGSFGIYSISGGGTSTVSISGSDVTAQG